jgi:protein tyrosine phosphatase
MTEQTKLTGTEAPDYSQYDSYLEQQLWSEILPGLWQGGTDDEDVIGDDTYAKPFSVAHKPQITKQDFDTVVTLYQYANPADWFVKEYRYGVYDSTIEEIDIAELYATVDFAHQEWKRGNKVLIRCQAGWNRSGLVTALVLIREGYAPRDAIQLIRDKRSRWALCNDNFVEFLLTLEN